MVKSPISLPKTTHPVVFLKEVKAELLKVTWPTKDELIRLTGTVLLVSLAVGLFIGGVDFLFAKVLGLIFGR